MTIGIGRAWRTVLFLAFVLGVVLWAAGAFRGGRVEPVPAAPPPGLPVPARTAAAERVPVAIHEDAVGTVRSRTRVVVAAQVMARILEVRGAVGTAVRKGDPMVALDDREARARVDRAREAVAAAEAARAQAEQSRARAEAGLARARSAHDRAKGFLEKGVATAEQMEEAESQFLQAGAAVAGAAAAVSLAESQVEQARHAVAEAEISLGYASIAAPVDGVVVERTAEPGDLAVPGAPLLAILDPASLRLEARIREGLIARVKAGDRLPVALPAAGVSVEGTVEEIIPAADPISRSFEVRVALDPVPGVYPGMFGRLRLPAGTRTVVRVPAEAVTRVGQLRTVAVREEGGWFRRLVTVGADLGEGRVEVLSGLSGGETLGMP